MHQSCCSCLAVEGTTNGSCITLVLYLQLSFSKLLLVKQFKVMSANDTEELIDYEDEHDVPNVGATSTSNGATTSAGDLDEKDKKNFSGIHSTGFR